MKIIISSNKIKEIINTQEFKFDKAKPEEIKQFL